MKKDHPIG
ncbi:Protein of unknown function [Bacillus wiedmannii]|uniref:Uncharacterized protein n=1 Tax=Bacillus wiedmannii TaxID=1890302 RepID=A0AB37YQ54_9BACI|nr:Protein of unknown function [Bacillus wiedmannii]